MKAAEFELVADYLEKLQDQICEGLESEETQGSFKEDRWNYAQGGGGRSRVIESGEVFERGGVNYSHVQGEALPPAATKNRPELAGAPFEAMGVSLVIHPRNPYVPTSHANVRCFIARPENKAPVWWFGGGFDLTPYYGFETDAEHWHRVAKEACQPYGDTVYPECKKWCDDYFYLKHRGHCRGVGGLFFDDWNRWDFEQCFAFMRSVGDAYLMAYLPILQLRKETPYGERERDWQLCRRGRYVEYNLVFDRGTLFGLQSGGRTESILMSMPPLVSWKYDYHPEPGTDEAELESKFLQPREWLI